MQIIHIIDSFLYELFDLKDTNLEALISVLTKFYTIGNAVPKVTVRENLLIVELGISESKSSNSDFDLAVSLCNKGEFNKAKELLLQFLRSSPAHSEANRVLGQIYSEEGDQDKAQDYFIEALKWDPKNASALIMMGNILSNYRKDVATSQKYFEQAIKVKPNDHIILNNVGGNLLKMRRHDEAKKYFLEALGVKEDYPNTHFGLALIANAQGDLHSGFYSSIKAIKTSQRKDSLYEQATDLAFKTAEEIIKKADGARDIVEKYLQSLEHEFDLKITLENDRTIALPAYLELAEKYKRDFHVVRYNAAQATHDYWIMHALVMLNYILEARAENANLLFYTDNVTRTHFSRSIQENLQSLKSKGLGQETLEKLTDDLYLGLNQQIHNTPVGLFVEEFLYHDFAELRPYQFISLHQDLQNGIRAATNESIREMAPKQVFSISKIYNLLKAQHFHDLFGIDLIADFEASEPEERQALNMFHEFSEYRQDKNPADEYKLLASWAKVLNVDSFFELVPEGNEAVAQSAPKKAWMKADGNSEQPESDSEYQDAEMKKFQQKAAALGLNMAVVMYMVDALEYFNGMSKDVIKKAAMEIAILGTNGIQPEKQGYKINAVPGKSFSGYHLLAYYYVTFAMVLPEMLKELQLPYDEEYKLAKEMHKK